LGKLKEKAIKLEHRNKMIDISIKESEWIENLDWGYRKINKLKKKVQERQEN
jgi:hypothetical protein